jgi:5,5'-dehydrodivanillate O-demethylase
MVQVAATRQGAAVGVDYAHTGAQTPAGRYMRLFWQPVYHSVDLVAGKPVPLRIMNELFTLYRGESGRAYLVGAHCPHRRTLLATGRVERDELRCFYHGWKFGGDGRCVEQPAEESRFCSKVSIPSYPVREYLGLIFVYLGEGEPPEFPLYPEFESFVGLVEIDSYSRECNFYQNVENALDMSHVGFAHGDNQVAFNGIGLGRSLTAEESEWGVTYTFTRADGELRIQQLGMPNIFYMTALPNDPEVGWQESLFWWVPIDDDRHMQFSLHRVPVTGEKARQMRERRQKRRSQIDLAHQDVCAQILAGMIHLTDLDLGRVDLVRLQDDIAQVGQGVIADRVAERLGRADIGTVTTRKLWRREIAAMLQGQPLKQWRRGPKIVPRTWGLNGPPHVGGGHMTEGVKAEIVDVRPYVEIAVQRRALHGGLSR